MQARARNLLAIPTAAVGALALIYFLFGWFGFEPLVKWALPKYVAEHGGRQLSLAQARFDPLHLSVDLHGIKLTEPDGKPLLAMERLFVDFDAASVLKRAYVFDEVRLAEPVVAVEIRHNGQMNWLDFVDAFVGPPQRPRACWCGTSRSRRAGSTLPTCASPAVSAPAPTRCNSRSTTSRPCPRTAATTRCRPAPASARTCAGRASSA
jgi:hypothetical protein